MSSHSSKYRTCNRQVNISPVTNDDGLILDGHISVGHWESECQELLVRATVECSRARVLEVGYGLGMASAAISRANPRHHVLIESNPTLAHQCQMRHGIRLPEAVICSTWQRIATILRPESFDAIVFDSDPDAPADLGWETPQVLNWVLPAIRELSPLLDKTGRFGFIDFTGTVFGSPLFKSVTSEHCMLASVHPIRIDPPIDCRYASPGECHIVCIQRD